jgi:uncharacterized membrane protein YdjX (TVP38/TMEM64 family)
MKRVVVLIAGMLALFVAVFLITRHLPALAPTAVAQILQSHRSIMLPVGWALMVADLILPVPATVVVAMFGWQWGIAWGAAAGALGSVLASLTAYGLCRAIGRRAAVFLAGEEGLCRMEGFFKRWGIVAVAVSRSLPLVPETLSCLAGLGRMPFGQFLVGSVVGAIPMAICFACIGAWGKVTEEPGWSLLLSAGLPVILIVPVMGVLRKRPGVGAPAAD